MPQNDAEALSWLRKAAEQGHAVAQHNFGHMFNDGQGVQQDLVEAVKWFRNAAEQGLAEAQYSLGLAYYYGKGVPEDNVLAHVWFSLAALQKPTFDSAISDSAMENRKFLEEQMTPAQITKAQTLAREWMEKQGKSD